MLSPWTGRSGAGAWRRRLEEAARARLWYRPVLRAAQALIASNERKRQELVELGLTREAVLIPHGVLERRSDIGERALERAAQILFLVPPGGGERPAFARGCLRESGHRALRGRVSPSPDPTTYSGARLRAHIEALPAAVRTRVEPRGPSTGPPAGGARRAWVLCLPSRYESFGRCSSRPSPRGPPWCSAGVRVSRDCPGGSRSERPARARRARRSA